MLSNSQTFDFQTYAAKPSLTRAELKALYPELIKVSGGSLTNDVLRGLENAVKPEKGVTPSNIQQRVHARVIELIEFRKSFTYGMK